MITIDIISVSKNKLKFSSRDEQNLNTFYNKLTANRRQKEI